MRPKVLLGLQLCFLPLLLLSAFSISANAMPLVQKPALLDASVISHNWSGYAISGSPGSVSDIKGSWLVPTVTCSFGENSASSFWIGIDGFSSKTVEQIGTVSECVNGTPVYSAFFEIFPKNSHRISSMHILQHETISAEVKFDGKFTLSLNDTTTGASFTKFVKDSLQERSSAEWIAEAPTSPTLGLLPLSNFGAVFWGHEFTAITGTNSATVGGSTGSISSFGTNVQQITMVTFTGLLKARPSPLSADGMSFTVLWFAHGP